MAKYGITWWGQQWLNSLSRIDFSNRLPRGRRYAGNGSVKTIEISGNKIFAKVKGSRPKPYNISIAIPLFSETQKDTLIEIINTNPQLLSKLLNKELSPELNTLAENEGIHIFPASWKDFEMNCSCPDWAVPCKHLAAVLYIVANEIDKNPFMAFSLHGIDLLDEFEYQGIANPLSLIPQLKELLTPYKEQECKPLDSTQLLNIDLSKISVNPPDVMQLPAASPPFYPKDFKDLLQKVASAVSKYVKKGFENINDGNVQFDPESKVRIFLNSDLDMVVGGIKTSEKYYQVSLHSLLRTISTIEYKELTSIDSSWVFLYKTYMFCLQLLANKLWYPKLLSAADEKYLLRYMPALFCEEPGKVCSQILPHLPGGLLLVQMNDKKKTLLEFSSIRQQFDHLCSVFLSHIIGEVCTSGSFPPAWYQKQDQYENVIDLFSSGKAGGFNTFRTSLLPASIYQWLSVFDIHNRNFTTILQIEEHESGFCMSLLISGSDESTISPVILSEVFTSKKFDKHRLEILKDLSLIGNYLPQVNTLLSNKGKENVIIPLSVFSGLLTVILPIVKLLGVNIILPKSLKSLVFPGLYLQLKKNRGKQVSVKSLAGLTELLDYQWQVSLGDLHIDADEFLKMVHGLSGLVKLKDQYIFLDEAQIKALQKNLEKNRELSSFQLIQAALSEEISVAKAGLSPDCARMVKDLLHSKVPGVPKDLKATLRPYQVKGFEWMVRNTLLGMGSIIADDMGLGKTLQVIAFLLHQKNAGKLAKNKALAVVPTSLISNWEHELERFAPSLTFYSYHGTERSDSFRSADVVITSFGMVRNNLKVFENLNWHTVIVDEAQNIKNTTAEQTKAIKKLKGEVRIAMSGTPVENRLIEYWSIFDFSNKGYLGNINWFTEEFAKPIQQNHDMNKVEHFRRITAPFLLRRMKTDKSIISDLPDKVENNHLTTLAPNQAALYQNVVSSVIQQIEKSEGIERKGLVLKLMTALKQIGNHPYQYLKQGNKEPELSGKSSLLLELVKNILENDQKVLIFTQYKEMGDLLCEFITAETSEKPLFLHGGCSRKQRDEMVDKFQNHYNKVFILSLKAGGTGLNLTAAGNVIHYDLWWNPAVESQATDRAFRIGQTKNVIVSRLINKGTIEEKIDKMIQDKRALADLTVSTGETWIGNLTNAELKELVKLEY